MSYLTCATYVLLFCFLSLMKFTTTSFMHSDIEYDGQLNVILQHALDNTANSQFTDRGTVTVQSIRSGSVLISQNPVTAEDRLKMKELNVNNGIYRLRAIVTTASGKSFSFLTFTKGCALYESQLTDILTISLDCEGNPVAVSMAANPGTCEGIVIPDKKITNFNTTVFVQHMEQGPTPDTTAYIQKLEKEKEARDRGETKDNRSFFAKYWMYIVPVVIFVLLSSAANPEAGGAAGGR